MVSGKLEDLPSLVLDRIAVFFRMDFDPDAPGHPLDLSVDRILERIKHYRLKQNVRGATTDAASLLSS